MTMADHYYSAQPASAHDIRRISAECLGLTLWFDTDAGVFSRDGLDPGSRTLLEALPALHGRVLDLGCGWGPVGAFMKRAHPDIECVLTDVNPRAAALARANCALNGIDAEVLEGDGFENVTGRFDFIVTNPPIRTGKDTIYGLFREGFARLNEGGRMYIVIRKQQGAQSALKMLRELDGEALAVAKKGGYWVLEVGKR